MSENKEDEIKTKSDSASIAHKLKGNEYFTKKFINRALIEYNKVIFKK